MKGRERVGGMSDLGKDIVKEEESMVKKWKERYERVGKDVEVIKGGVEKGEMG